MSSLRQFLCPYSNLSACLPIEGQNQVREIFSGATWEIISILFVVHIDTLESNHSPGNSSSSCARHSRIFNSWSDRKSCSSWGTPSTMHDENKSRFFLLSFLQYLPIPDTTKNVPGRTSSAQNQYIFQASLPALGYSTYYFEAKGKSHWSWNYASIICNSWYEENQARKSDNNDKWSMCSTERSRSWISNYSTDRLIIRHF
jgi:hypothetical protein